MTAQTWSINGSEPSTDRPVSARAICSSSAPVAFVATATPGSVAAARVRCQWAQASSLGWPAAPPRGSRDRAARFPSAATCPVDKTSGRSQHRLSWRGSGDTQPLSSAGPVSGTPNHLPWNGPARMITIGMRPTTRSTLATVAPQGSADKVARWCTGAAHLAGKTSRPPPDRSSSPCSGHRSPQRSGPAADPYAAGTPPICPGTTLSR